MLKLVMVYSNNACNMWSTYSTPVWCTVKYIQFTEQGEQFQTAWQKRTMLCLRSSCRIIDRKHAPCSLDLLYPSIAMKVRATLLHVQLHQFTRLKLLYYSCISEWLLLLETPISLWTMHTQCSNSCISYQRPFHFRHHFSSLHMYSHETTHTHVTVTKVITLWQWPRFKSWHRIQSSLWLATGAQTHCLTASESMGGKVIAWGLQLQSAGRNGEVENKRACL